MLPSLPRSNKNFARNASQHNGTLENISLDHAFLVRENSKGLL
jgi:hypothetical protein